MINTLSIALAETRYAEAIKEILRNEKLPTEDLPADMNNFYIATDNGFVIGSIGLEIYGNFGFLRSLAVKPEYRSRKVGGELVKKIEAHAKQLGLRSIYLLTEKTSSYFEGKGYKIVQRKDVPPALQHSSEFTHTCPQSAIAMLKEIK